ncbi:hypothetical protein HU200_017541 [Digitaria exilis]|uniref:At1g61320/AtMIF1 LRR domain-containing protein n=1 Tax=Digitaria exilis TaxID=1010633 RepID=A0A835F655_9POAL|nr:hypothetical protein HU200_017541 [Digitaria exilis]
MPMQYAARVACVSQAFLRSWRHHPDLTFTEETLGLKKKAWRKDERAKYFTSKVDRILRNHSGIGVKKLKLQASSHANYNFPCSVLSDGTADSLRYLHLASCNFHPTVSLGCLRSLTRLQLSMVRVTGDELRYLLSRSFVLEQLELSYCSEIICLKIPCLHQLSYLEVLSCKRLQVIVSKALNLSGFRFAGDRPVQLSLGDTSQIRKLDWFCSDALFYACTEFPSSMPNLENLTIYSRTEMVNTPMVPNKFLHLKLLSIALGGPMYDYLSLVSFLEAAPSLETFILTVRHFFADPSDPRRMPEQCHDNLKRVNIINFSSTKSLVALTCHIIEFAKCSVNKSGECFLMHEEALVEAQRAVLVFQTYIKRKVPSKVNLTFLEPCSRCHAADP